MTLALYPSVLVSLAFLLANGLLLWAILRANRRAAPSPPAAPSASQASAPPAKTLSAADILAWEFEYARITASEANAERHTMVNFDLLIAGVAASGVVAVLGRDAGLPTAVGTALLWLLCGVGWVYFLAIIRLREAWHDSLRTMNRIKEFYIQHAQELDSEVLRSAFRWQPHTLPPPGKPWTVYFYAATLIALLNSAAYVGGGALLDLQAVRAAPLAVLGPLALSGLAFFAFHVWLYFAFLRPKGGAHAKKSS